MPLRKSDARSLCLGMTEEQHGRPESLGSEEARAKTAYAASSVVSAEELLRI